MFRFFLSIVSLFVFQNIFSQEIYIPYRNGNLWGICNEKADILIEPQYDKVEFERGYDAKSNIFYTTKNNKKGLVVNGKIIADCIYDIIYKKEELFVLIQNNKSTEIITFQGQQVLNFAVLTAKIENFKNNLLFCEVVHQDYSESIFLLNGKNYTIEQWLYKNYYSLNILKTKAEFISINAKKTANDGLVTESWNFSKLPVEKAPQNQNIWQVKYLDKFNTVAEKYRSKYDIDKGSYSGSGSGNGAGRIREYIDDIAVVEDIKADRFPDAVYDLPSSQQNISKTISGYTSFSKSNSGISLDITLYNTPNSKKSKMLPYKDFEIVNVAYRYKNQDTLINCSNYLKVKNKEKQGVVVAQKPLEIVYFDTILKSYYYYNDTDNGTSVIVGNKDKNTWKYNLFLLAKNSTSPYWYDEIIELKDTNYKTKYLKVKNNNQYGLMATNGEIVLKPEYEEIDFEATNRYYDESYHYLKKTKKDNKYGAIYLVNGSIRVVEPFFEYPVVAVDANYPRENNRYYSNNTNKVLNTIVLLTIKDNSGKLIGYANSNGTLYYKN